MKSRSTICILTAWLVAASASAQVEYFEFENAATLGTNYVSVADTNVPPFAYNSAYITSTVNKTAPPGFLNEENAIFHMPTLPTNTLYDLYLRVHVGTNTFNDDSVFLANEFWITGLVTNTYNGDFGFNGIAGLTGLDGFPTTSDGFHWVLAPVTYNSFDGTDLTWACAPREDGLDLDALAFIPSGWPVPDLTLNEILNPTNAGVELWAGNHDPTLPSSTPTPVVTAYFVDGAGTANTNSVTVTLNGASVTNFSVEYADWVTTVSFTPESALATPSENTVEVVVASSPGGTPVTNGFTFSVAGEPIVYVDISANNTVMALSSDGPVGAGTALVTTNVDNVNFWRFRTDFGVPSTLTNEPTQGDYAPNTPGNTIFQSLEANNAQRLKTTAFVQEPGFYQIFAYFWDNGAGWDVRAGLEDTPGTNSLALYNTGNTTELFAVGPDYWGTHTFQRALLGTVKIADTNTPIVVYTEDAPTVGGRTFLDGIGFQLSEPPILYVDIDSTNTVMAVSSDGPVGAGTALVTTNVDNVNYWRLRTGEFGFPPTTSEEPTGEGYAPYSSAAYSVFQSLGTNNNAQRLKTSAYVDEPGFYSVFAYFWTVDYEDWDIRAGLEDTPGTNSLTLYNRTNTAALFDIGPDFWGLHTFLRASLGTVEITDTNTPIVVYTEDAPTTVPRAFLDGIGYQAAIGGIPTPAPTIVDVTVAGGMATLTWTSETTATYSIQHKTNVTDAVWTAVKTGIAGGSPTTTDSVPVSGADQEFFRIEGN